MDVCVTCPQWFWEDWIAEGDAAGAPESGEDWHFYLAGYPPLIEPGERVYVVARGKLRGYAPLVRVERTGAKRFALVRRGGAVAVTIPESIRGFRGWRAVWWPREIEKPFPDWKAA